VILLGPPAAGKSTLVPQIIAGHPGIERFVVGHQLDEERRGDTDLWAVARPYAEKRAWIPDAVVVELFARRLRRLRAPGMLLEGLPANGEQAVMVRDLLDSRAGSRRILYVDAPDEVCTARVRHRRICRTCDDGSAPARPSADTPYRCETCGGPTDRRDDDTDAIFAERLRTHRRNAPDILRAYPPHELVVLDASGTPESVAAGARSALG
jgi:adenylate kinase family enzyme